MSTYNHLIKDTSAAMNSLVLSSVQRRVVKLAIVDEMVLEEISIIINRDVDEVLEIFDDINILTS